VIKVKRGELFKLLLDARSLRGDKNDVVGMMATAVGSMLTAKVSIPRPGSKNYTPNHARFIGYATGLYGITANTPGKIMRYVGKDMSEQTNKDIGALEDWVDEHMGSSVYVNALDGQMTNILYAIYRIYKYEMERTITMYELTAMAYTLAMPNVHGIMPILPDAQYARIRQNMMSPEQVSQAMEKTLKKQIAPTQIVRDLHLLIKMRSITASLISSLKDYNTTISDGIRNNDVTAFTQTKLKIIDEKIHKDKRKLNMGGNYV
jgi:hypothetical protein